MIHIPSPASTSITTNVDSTFHYYAVDEVGNQTPERIVHIHFGDTYPPTVSIHVSDPSLEFTVNWLGDDPLSGVQSFDVDYKIGKDEIGSEETGTWTSWLAETELTGEKFFGTAGEWYTFRARARDNAGNVSCWVKSHNFAIQTVTKYYFFGQERVAMRHGNEATSPVYYLSSDHLGSINLLTRENGQVASERRYLPFGEERWASGEPGTDVGFTGQRQEDNGLMYYNARFYDPYLNRFLSPDDIIPDPYNVLDWDRYAYARNNPVKFNDPSGHSVDCGLGDPGCRAGKLPAPVPVNQTPKGPTLVSTPTLPFNPSGIYFGPYGPTATPQTVLRAGPTRTPTPTGTPTPLPPGEVAKQMGEEVADKFSPFRYDPGSATGTDVSSMILSGAQSISMSSPQLSWVYPVAQTVVGSATGFGAIWDAALAVEKWWSDANANMSATATMLPINGPTVSPTTSHATSTPVPIPFPTYTPTFPPPHW